MIDIKKIQIEIEELEKKVQDAERSTAMIEGKIQTLKEQLLKEFKCNTIEEAKTLLEKLRGEIKKLEEEGTVLEEDLQTLLEKNK